MVSSLPMGLFLFWNFPFTCWAWISTLVPQPTLFLPMSFTVHGAKDHCHPFCNTNFWPPPRCAKTGEESVFLTLLFTFGCFLRHTGLSLPSSLTFWSHEASHCAEVHLRKCWFWSLLVLHGFAAYLISSKLWSTWLVYISPDMHWSFFPLLFHSSSSSSFFPTPFWCRGSNSGQHTRQASIARWLPPTVPHLS